MTIVYPEFIQEQIIDLQISIEDIIKIIESWIDNGEPLYPVVRVKTSDQAMFLQQMMYAGLYSYHTIKVEGQNE